MVSWSILLKDYALFSIFSIRYAYTACIGVIWSFLPLFAHAKFDLPGSLIGILAMLGVFVAGVLSLPMGYAADRINKKFMAVTGGVLSTIGMFLLFHAASFQDLIIGVLVFGTGGGISMPAVMGYAVIMGEQKKAMGSIMSIMTMAHSMGMLTGAMAAGIAVDFLSLPMAFLCGSAMMAAGTAAFLIFRSLSFSSRAE
jgi:MFS family permease